MLHHCPWQKLLPLVSVFVFLCMGCQTNEHKAYEKLQLGMEKAQVLEIMGNPQQSRRWHGMDRWDYRFYHDNVKYEKQVNFENGKSVYIGDPVQPEVSAEAQDSIQEKANQELEKKWSQERAKQQQSFPKYESDVSGQSENQELPTFHPVQ